MNKPTEKVEAIFEAALALETDAQRAEYLDRACSDLALRQEVESLLEAHRNPDSVFSDETVLAPTPLSEGPGTKIGRYKLLQQIGEGGMGVVYMAEQEEPVRRRVALKIIKLGMDTKQVVARFEAERQALALMDHPNIAKVLDGGATETGRPYFVMELVQGVPITDFCDKAKLSAKDRLKLFIQVCQAIQSAHQKGIIHRDIKPSNVLVTLHDGVPVPKVIDFGIAKATNQKLTEKTLFTNFATMIGTPAYMSPEQAEMSGLDIDTRTDIYALGVLLYALLTGTTPFPEKRLRSLGYGEMQRVILEEEPERPSTRLSTMANEQKTIVARNCGEELASLSNLLKGDLDWIVMKCLEKERQRRYETANGLASDIQRHLSNEPVVARPPSAGYRFQKMARRNKGAFVAVTAVAAALILGVIISAWQAIRATNAERLQNKLRQEAVKAQSGEAKQRALAEQRVYDSLVREARALRLARRVGYREEAFSTLRRAAALEGVQKDFEQMRREAMLCMGDFVGLVPVTFTNFIPGFKCGPIRLSPSGHVVVYQLWNREEKKAALSIRSLHSGKDLATVVTESVIQEYGFASDDQFAVIYVPANDLGEERSQRYSRVEVGTWAVERDGSWREVSRRAAPGAYSLVAFGGRTWLAVDDWRAGKVKFLDSQDGSVRLEIDVSKTSKAPAPFVQSAGEFLAIQTSDYLTDAKNEGAIWDLKAGREIRRFTLKDSEIVVGLSSGIEHLVTLIEDQNLLMVYDAQTMQPLERVPDVSLVNTMKPSLMANRTLMALPSIGQRNVRLIDYSRQDVVTLTEPDITFDARFTDDGRSLLTAGPVHARKYDLAGPKEIQIFPGNENGGGAVFHPHGSRIATVGFEDTLRVWRTETGQLVFQKKIPPWEIFTFSPDGKWLIVPSYGTQEVRFFDSDTGELVLTLGSDAVGGVQSVVMTRDGRYLVAATRTEKDISRLLTSDNRDLGSILVWELDYSGNPARVSGARIVHKLEGKYSSLALVGSRMEVAFFDCDLKPAAYVWDFANGLAPRKLKIAPRWSYHNLCPTPDGRRLWMLDAEDRLVCVDVATGEPVTALTDGTERRTPGAPGSGISLSPDGTKLAIPSPVDPMVKIFDTASGRLVYSLPQRSGSPSVSGWGPDSQRILVTSSKGDVTIWNLAEVDRILAELGLSVSAQGVKSSGIRASQ